MITQYDYKKEDSIFHAISKGAKQAEKYQGIPGGINGAGQYIKDNKIKSSLFSVAVASVVFTAMHMKAGFIAGAEASGFLAKTSKYFVGTHEAMTASMPGFIGTSLAGQIVAGVIMAAAAFATVYAACQACSSLKDIAVERCKGQSQSA